MARRMRPDPQLFMLMTGASGHHGRGGRAGRAVWAADAEYRDAAGGKR
jgi:hypothetical protein